MSCSVFYDPTNYLKTKKIIKVKMSINGGLGISTFKYIWSIIVITDSTEKPYLEFGALLLDHSAGQYQQQSGSSVLQTVVGEPVQY